MWPQLRWFSCTVNKAKHIRHARESLVHFYCKNWKISLLSLMFPRHICKYRVSIYNVKVEYLTEQNITWLQKLPDWYILNKTSTKPTQRYELEQYTDLYQIQTRSKFPSETVFTHLLIELVDNALCPLQMQVLALQRPIDVSQFNAHLAHQ